MGLLRPGGPRKKPLARVLCVLSCPTSPVSWQTCGPDQGSCLRLAHLRHAIPQHNLRKGRVSEKA